MIRQIDYKIFLLLFGLIKNSILFAPDYNNKK